MSTVTAKLITARIWRGWTREDAESTPWGARQPCTVHPDGRDWRPIPNWPGHEASACGLVRSLRGKVPVILRPYIGPTGYPLVAFYKNGRNKTLSVAMLVLEAHVGPRPPGFHVCHNNGARDDPRLSNLRWDSPKANARDKIAHGRVNHGSRNGAASLTEDEVKQIRANRGWVSQRSLAEIFGVRTGAITYAQKHGWKHV